MAQIAFNEDTNDFAPVYKLEKQGADDTESMANTTAPATPMSNPTSSPQLAPFSPQLAPSDLIQEPSFQPLMGASADHRKRPAGHGMPIMGNGDAYRYHDRHGAIRYASPGYVMDITAPAHAYHAAPGAGQGTRLNEPCRVPCRHYGRDGKVVYR